MKWVVWCFVGALLVGSFGGVHADQEQDYQDLIQETRCMVCHNQNIADVDTPFAQHLRHVIHQELEAGASVGVIRERLRAQYGDAISYRPPQKGLSQGLWYLPGALLLLWALGSVLGMRKKQ